MNPDKELEKLLVEYQIDVPSERYLTCLRARRMLNQLVEGARHILLIADDIADAGMVKNDIRGDCTVFRCAGKEKKAIEKYLQECDIAIVVSFGIAQKQKEDWLETAKCFRVQLFFLYDYFSGRGLICEGEYYDVLQGKRIGLHGEKSDSFGDQNYYEAIYRDKRIYLSLADRNEKGRALAKLIFDYIFIKDFVYAKKYIYEYVKQEYAGFDRYLSFWRELECLLSRIKDFTAKQEEHLFIFWLDGLGKGEEGGMPFFNSLEEKGMVFDNAYTVTPTTSLTMKAIFLKKRFYEDDAGSIERIEEKNSSLLTYVKNNGYQFEYFGCKERFEEKLYGKIALFKTPSSMLHWDLLCDICLAEQKKCYLIHDLPELHTPFQSGLLDHFFYITEGSSQNETESMERHAQRELGKRYFDEQLSFYQPFLAEKAKQIYMSDHAGEGGTPRRGNGSHTNLLLTGKGIKKQRIPRMFSYLNFDRLVQYLCETDDRILEEALEDYVTVEYPDVYANWFVKSVVRGRNVSLSSFGWRGCVTQKDEYFIYSIGKEIYYTYPSWVNRVHLPECRNRVQYLKGLAGDKFGDVHKAPFGRLLHRVWEQYMERTGGQERGTELLCRAVSEIPENQVIAVRGGGRHTSGLLYALGEAAARISYVVDRNSASDVCFEGPGLHFDIITPEEMEGKKIDVVILSSLRCRKEMLQELLKMQSDYKIIDVYGMLEEEGIFLDRGFYQPNLIEEDYAGVDI